MSGGTFPKLWKRANVVPIYKKGSVRDPNNYRSVSLMPLFGKVFEKLVYVQMLSHVLPVITEAQHGFIYHVDPVPQTYPFYSKRHGIRSLLAIKLIVFILILLRLLLVSIMIFYCISFGILIISTD